MAETVIDATVQILVGKLIAVATEEFSLVLGFKNELKRLKKSLEMTQAFLHDASKRQLEDESVKVWLKNLEDVAYDADNLLDEFNYEIIRRKVDVENQMKQKVCFLFTLSNPFAFRSKMAHKVKDVNMKLKMVNEEASSYGLQKIVTDSAISLPLVMETDSITFDPIVIGRENDVAKIVKVFVESSNEVISVIPIVGMGGLGKTTLARTIFNHERTLELFEERIWICVSENFDTTSLLKRILESLTKDVVMFESKETIVKKLQEKLGTKRYLLVLDDLWNDNRKKWDDFRRCLNGINNKKGNFIVVTTRRKDMASIVNSESNYALDSLLDNECWSIIRSRTFPKREVPKEFESIGLKIAGKCRGLPLAATMVGGTLLGKGIDDWTSILESGFSDANTEENEVLQVLKVSFDRLPSLLLKKCFAYCSVFKKDEKLNRDRLVQLWMAEGFLIENHENDMERMGERVFDTLLHSCFFLEVKEENFLGIKYYYKMHDLVHDLACLVSKTESFNAENHIPDRIPRVRYLAMKSLHEGAQNIMKDEAFYLRTLFWGNNVPDRMFQDLKHLRVLDVSETKIEELTASIDKLIHLRFLDVSWTWVKVLPESICKLFYLQTLRIIGCSYLKELPNQFHYLVSLRHLVLLYDVKVPRDIGKLTCLRTLTFFKVGLEKGHQIQELQYLKNLKGEIEIKNLELVTDKDEALKANLIEKPNIHELALAWNISLDGENNHEKVLEGLEPHPNIKCLSITGFSGDNFPSWILKMATISKVRLNNLIKINLSDCPRCQNIPTLGHLPLLESLVLQTLWSLKSIGSSFYHSHDCGQSRINASGSQPTRSTTVLFPALKDFKLFRIHNLVEWVGPAEDQEAFPRLENLEIHFCINMIIAPTHDFPSLRALVVDTMNSYHVLERITSNKLTSLVRVEIYEIPSLGFIGEAIFLNKPCLESFAVGSCQNLTHVGLSDNAHHLKSLTIKKCPNLISISYSSTQSQGFSYLKNLKIQYCIQLSTLPITEMLESCTSLESLIVQECHNLTSLPIDFNRVPHLSNVTISVLPKLTTFPKGFGSLTMLYRLDLGGFSEDSGFTVLKEILQDIQRLQKLDYLSVHGWPQWESLPDQIQHLTTLTYLRIKGFGIEALPEWIWNMSSLQDLKISFCEKLKHKPSEEAIQCLTRLQYLIIEECPLVGEVRWRKVPLFG